MTENVKPSGIVVQVGTATVRMRPVGFALYAEEFFIAGASIPKDSKARGNTTFTPVPYYLFCRSLELVLKAYLLAENVVSEEILKERFGHDLEKLWIKAKDHGIERVLGANAPHFEADLTSANAYYRSKVFEYFDFGRWVKRYKNLPPLERFRDEVKQIVEKTKEHCFAVS